MRRLAFLLLTALPVCIFSQTTPQAQQQGPVYQSQTVLRSNTRLVVVDVIATNDKGSPITDLKADDFILTEDGVPQKLSGFSFQRPVMTKNAPQQLAPGIVTNAPQFASSSSLNVILLDAINTDFSSRAYAQDMLIKYLESGPAIQPTAVFSLEGKLKMLHDFTTDTKVLRDVLANYKPLGPTHIPDVYSAAAAVFSQRGSYQASDHGREITFSAMRFLAHQLGGYPGRKNLIWVSEGFPLSLFPDAVMEENLMIINDYTPLVEAIADELMNAQVALYPIDAAGVSLSDRFPAHTAMVSMAERTGGKTFYNRNDIDMGVRTSIDDGSTYYTLQYYPQNKNWDEKFRKIEVKVERPGVKLQYRRGYYALSPGQSLGNRNASVNTEFSQAMVIDAPATAGVLFQAAMEMPSDKNQHKLVVNFGVDPHTIAFQQTPDDLQHAALSCVVWAYPAKGDPIQVDPSTVNANVKQDVYQQIMKSYLPCHRNIELKKGTYTLRLGVLDRTTNLMGTTSAKVTIQ